MTKKSWNELHPAVRTTLVVGGSLDVALRIAALVDLVRRPADEVRGRKGVWALGLATVSSLGALPLTYLTCHGRLGCPLCRGGKCRCGCPRRA